MSQIDTSKLCLSHKHTHIHTYLRGRVPLEKDFVNVNAIQWWQRAVSAVKWAPCWAECNDAQDNWNQTTGWLPCCCDAPQTADRRPGEQEPFKGVSSPSPPPSSSLHSLGNASPCRYFYLCRIPCRMLWGYWFCRSLSERSTSAFLVIPEFLAFAGFLQPDSGPEMKQHVVASQKDDSHVKATFKQQTCPRNSWKTFFFFSPQSRNL